MSNDHDSIIYLQERLRDQAKSHQEDARIWQIEKHKFERVFAELQAEKDELELEKYALAQYLGLDLATRVIAESPRQTGYPGADKVTISGDTGTKVNSSAANLVPKEACCRCHPEYCSGKLKNCDLCDEHATQETQSAVAKYWRVGKYEFGFSGLLWTPWCVTTSACECVVYEFGPLFLTILSPVCEATTDDET